jgi:hypothetical protein
MNAVQEMTEPLFGVGERVTLLGANPLEGRITARKWTWALFGWRYTVLIASGQQVSAGEEALALIEEPERWRRDPLRSFGSVIHCGTGRTLQRAKQPSAGVVRTGR